MGSTACEICYAEYNNTTHKKLELICGHDLCRLCMRAFYREIIEVNGIFRCPMAGCGKHTNPGSVLTINEMTRLKRREREMKEILEQRKKIRLYMRVRNELGLFKCPMDECDGKIVDYMCTKCETKVCPLCKEIVHNGKCAFRVSDLKIVTKMCPLCNTPIEKNTGCDHMHCTFCGAHFNWSDLQITSLPNGESVL